MEQRQDAQKNEDKNEDKTEDKQAAQAAKPQQAAGDGQPQGQAAVKSGEKYNVNLLLWAQICLCAAALGIMYGLKATNSSLFPLLRTTLRNELEAPGWYESSENRELLKFTQESLNELQQNITETIADVVNRLDSQPIGTALTRRRHGKPAPFGYSEDSYTPAQGLVFPLAGGSCNINSGYGWRAYPLDTSVSDFHGGVDLAAQQGQGVCAAAAGVVRQAGSHKSYGNYIRIMHPDGTETLYAHMQYLFARTGQRVAAGERIGTAGQTGDTTGPHLHFEIIYKGVRYDPAQALQAAA